MGKRTGNPNGRPPIPIDKKQFESLCGMLCTEEEIADFFGCSIDTVNRWCKNTYAQTFAEIYKQKRTLGKASLRRSGFKMAQTIPSVHIFYAKNFLGMTDKVEHTVHEVEDLTSLADMLNDDSVEDTDANNQNTDD